MKYLTVGNKKYTMPMYLPDATRSVVKCLDSKDLEETKTEGVVVNTYHLLENPGIEVIKKHGGIKGFMSFHGLVVSDSGGWQVFSLIHRNNNIGKITDAGVKFSLGGGKVDIFTPEDSVRAQFQLGSDILVCLDDFTPPGVSYEKAEETVIRTTLWATRCREEYEKQVKKRRFRGMGKPLLLSVVQGGNYMELRKKSARELMALGFDGYGYGGYAVDDEGNLDYNLSKYLADLLPSGKLKFALGVGRPYDVVKLNYMGWDVFDCTLPTRDARHRRLYTFNRDPNVLSNITRRDTYGFMYISRNKYQNDKRPVDRHCDCILCRNYSRAYLRHLFKINDLSAYRLASIHNLRVYQIIIQNLKINRER